MSDPNKWSTPQTLFDRLNAEFGFTLDPCATAENAKCKKFYTLKDDGLSQSWANERVFMNPPYGDQTIRWMAKAYVESHYGALVVCLVFARTDTAWWHAYAMQAQEIRYIQGRVKFGGKYNAPAPSVIVIFRPVSA